MPAIATTIPGQTALRDVANEKLINEIADRLFRIAKERQNANATGRQLVELFWTDGWIDKYRIGGDEWGGNHRFAKHEDS